MDKTKITIYLTDVVDGWVAWDGYTWDEESGAVLDKDREIAIGLFKEGLLKRKGITDCTGIEFTVIED